MHISLLPLSVDIGQSSNKHVYWIGKELGVFHNWMNNFRFANEDNTIVRY